MKQCFIEDEISIEIKDNTIVIRSTKEQKRKGWAEAFCEMTKNGDDALAIPDVFVDEDTTSEWTWR